MADCKKACNDCEGFKTVEEAGIEADDEKTIGFCMLNVNRKHLAEIFEETYSAGVHLMNCPYDSHPELFPLED